MTRCAVSSSVQLITHPPDMESHDAVVGVLSEARRLGMIGPGPIEAAVAHAQWFVDALRPTEPGSRIVDLGSGGGLPGLVIAIARPDVELLLVERRGKRSDFLRRMVRRLGLDHVEVHHGDVDELIASLALNGGPFDAVTARGFGPPEMTLRRAVQLTRPGGAIVISEPPNGDRWSIALLDELGVAATKIGSVRRFDVAAGC